MQNRITLFFLFLLTCTVAFAQKKELQSITENELKAHLQFISGDIMQGRDFGTPVPGLEITAEYLKSECLEMGLKPGADNFTQPFKLIQVKMDSSKTRLIVKNNKNEKIFKDNSFAVFPGNAGNDTISGKIVFAGYGWQNKETGYDDFEELDLKDKVVVFMTRNRDMVLDTTKKADITKEEMTKIGRIFLSGAKAAVIVPDPLSNDNSWFKMARDFISGGSYQLEGTHKEAVSFGNIILADVEVADAMLKETGKTVAELQQKINETGKPASIELQNTTVEFIVVKQQKPVSGENIIAIVEGSDPVLKNECVVLSAHYDHVGMNTKGEIFNGADDNGSGTVTLLEVAEAFSQMKKKPRRSIVFLWCTAEEKGLFGSEYYVENPVFSLDKTVANINLDMVGRAAKVELAKVEDSEKSLAGPNGIYLITGENDKDLTSITDRYCKKLNLVPSKALSEEFLNGSDQFNFYKKHIPILGLTTGLHEDYHQPTDDLDKIDFYKMKRIADLTFLVTFDVANSKKPLEKTSE